VGDRMRGKEEKERELHAQEAAREAFERLPVDHPVTKALKANSLQGLPFVSAWRATMQPGQTTCRKREPSESGKSHASKRRFAVSFVNCAESRVKRIAYCFYALGGEGEGVSGEVEAASIACASPRVTTRGRGEERETAS
jgi:hypothetical protein